MRFVRKYILAGNPKTAEKTLRQLASVDDATVRCRLAENSSTPADVLERLCHDFNPEVRAALVFNSAVSLDILKELCNDEDLNVRLSLAEGKELPEPVLTILTEDENPYVRDCAERTLEIRALEARLKADNFKPEPGEDARLGALLCKSGWLDGELLSRLLDIAEGEQKPLGQIILQETDLSHETVVAALKAQGAIRRGQTSITDAVEALHKRHSCLSPGQDFDCRPFQKEEPVTRASLRKHSRPQDTYPGPLAITATQNTNIPWRIWQTSQYRIDQILADSDSLADAAAGLLQAICQAAHWDAGVLWEVNHHNNQLTRVDAWQVSTGATPLSIAELPGQAWRTGTCVWSSDIPVDPEQANSDSSKIVSSLAFPIQTQDNVAGVMEFFYREGRRTDESMAILEAAGHQIGLFIERKEAQKRLREFHAIIAAIGGALIRTANMKELLQSCAQAIVTHLNAAFARIWTLDETGNYLILQASAGLYTHIDGAHQRIRVGQFKVGLIASEQKPHLTNDVQNDPRVSNKEWAKKEGMMAFAGYPLMVDGKLVGVMALFARQALTQNTIEALGSIADHVALGIKRKLNEDSQRKLASIVESCNDAIVSSDLDGMITQCNEAAEQLCGYSTLDLLYQPISMLFACKVSSKQLFNVEKLQRGENLKRFETIFKRGDGSLVDVSMTLSAIRDSAGEMTGVAIIARDISQRKRNEKLLSVQYSAARIMAESTSLNEAASKIIERIAQSFQWQWGAFWMVDERHNHLRCRFVWNNGSEALHELTSISKIMPLAPGVGTIGQAYAQSRFCWAPDFSTSNKCPRAGIAQKAGTHACLAFPIILSGKVLAVFEFVDTHIDEPDNDLINMMSSLGVLMAQFMERKAAEEKAQLALQAEQKIAQSIIHLAPAAIARLDMTLAIKSFNRQFAEQFAASAKDPEELMEKFIFQLLPDLPNEKLIHAVESKIPFSLNNYTMTSGAEKRVKHWDLAGWPVEADDGGMIVMAIEVTDKVKLAQQRDDFVATLTHDLKNPLIGAIRVLSFMLEGKGGNLDQNQIALLKTLASSNQHMLDLISHLLEIYRYEAGCEQLNFVPVDVKTLVKESVQHSLAATADLKVDLRMTFCQSDNTISADRLAISRVIENLLSNAIKFTGENGEIVVTGSKCAETYILEVKDTGSGISKRDREKIFERYSQGEHGLKHKMGTGLGLYLCRKIVEGHAGTITCDSEVGRGAVFTVRLPIRQSNRNDSN